MMNAQYCPEVVNFAFSPIFIMYVGSGVGVVEARAEREWVEQ